jgi:Ribulose-5-phosphate 4-epimerase and related epimerases and aldolases
MIPMISDLKQELVETVRFLHNKGFAPATSSNYSFRRNGETSFYVSESGIDKASFGERHFVHVTAEGQPIGDSRKTSAETLLHCLIYRCSTATSVLHTHTVHNTVVSRFFEKQER